MKTVFEHIRTRLLQRAGLLEIKNLSIESLRKSERSERFEQLCRNRMILGAFRYGKLGDLKKPQYDRINSIIERAEMYKNSGNDELLCDIANLCLCEFVEGMHPNKHFHAVDEHNYHLKEVSK